MGHFFITEKDFKEEGFEFVERKGLGHPDTLADALAETLSVEYSNYTLKRYGAILHHNFDKVGLLGGSSFVALGEGYMTQPIRILVNGRVSTKFGNEEIPVRKIIADWVKEFFKKRLPMINVDNDLKIHFNLSNKSSPGKTYEKESKRGTRRYWFEPRGLYDIQELKKLLSNDTSLGVGYAPYSVLEKIVLEIENTLSSDKYKFKNKWLVSEGKYSHQLAPKLENIAEINPSVLDYVRSLVLLAGSGVCPSNKEWGYRFRLFSKLLVRNNIKNGANISKLIDYFYNDWSRWTKFNVSREDVKESILKENERNFNRELIDRLKNKYLDVDIDINQSTENVIKALRGTSVDRNSLEKILKELS
ncbi:hypothetical protein KKD04_00560 [Patescibacteria group bacterium]|nr:hypothetical protein [Patescibacteria group bacterium]